MYRCVIYVLFTSAVRGRLHVLIAYFDEQLCLYVGHTLYSHPCRVVYFGEQSCSYV